MGMFFVVKRLVGMAAQPLSLVFFLCLTALLCRRWSGKGKGKSGALAKASPVCLAAAVLILFLASFPPVVRWQAGWFEDGLQPLLAPPAGGPAPAAIVVLGNGVAHPGDGAMPALTRLNDAARARLVEGVRLAGMFPDIPLHVTGFGMGLENCADAMALAARELGLPEERLRRHPEAADTGQEADLIRQAVGKGRVVLVTTAVHMPRALFLFRTRGLDPLPAPCGFIAPVSAEPSSALGLRPWRPRGGAIADSEAIWHEALGLVYCRLFERERE